ncbi:MULTISPECIES: ribose-phosphate diphosphokinase [Dictyoglomus]|jgi:ribose-phosphate pyrophosphokinase|uniref:Ribose-phosphate pyrophosphokinase n=1 Tax=Dictyoglomus turgidum (strain DSM 6724 / Z-1310) TaxID=515635 RepID=B8DZY1_DICTD|nr:MULTISPECIES: ribose-phosphate pyrophosphokinase [Dictyoglomus]ACK42064.1 ribose-phosphate pyrophosphokinase [Dictyoglomus turgidum DSM 6724]HBU32295.1 ribose-phosphate pyrophosphokinase [Dictyoglomus sp.]
MGQRCLALYSGTSNRELAEEVAKYLGIELGEIEIRRFSDGEIYARIAKSVRGAEVYVIQSLGSKVNEYFMELLIIIDALKRASADEVTAVIPYYAYARQDRKTKSREPISAKLIANLLTVAGASRVVTMDLHAGQIQGFFDIPVDNLSALPLFTRYFQDKNLKNPVVVSPDIGGVTRARALADRLHTPLAIIYKRRPAPEVAEVEEIIGEVEGRDVIICDDIVTTGNTLFSAAKLLKLKGARDIYAAVTHGILTNDAHKKLQESEIKELVVTNTIPIPLEKRVPKLTIISIGNLLGEAIKRISNKDSLSSLFD